MADENKKISDKQMKPKRSYGRLAGIIVLWLFAVIMMGGLFAGGAAFGYVSSIVKDEPVRSRSLIDQKMSENLITSFAYFRDNSPIGQLRTEEDRRPVEYKQIPPIVIDAIVSIEDNNFFNHNGVDMNGTLRAVKQRFLKESIQTGGSTLTQQLARRVFLNLDRTEDRKIKEILLSMRLERFLTKEEILTAYLNKVPFGNGSSGYNLYGIKAAAKGIFNINDLNTINIAEAAYLAGLPQLPSKYSAYNGKGQFNSVAFKRAIDRQHLVLRRMLEENKITQAQYKEALAFDIRKNLAPHMDKAYATFPYLMMETERQATEVIMSLNEKAAGTSKPKSSKDDNELYEAAQQQLTTGGYRVYTTIDRKVYSLMHKISENKENFSPDSKTKGMEQTAAIMLDNKNGAILGMIEGRDFYKEQMNYATQMKRQPGSTMKPIAAYLPAIESGAVQPASVLDDAPIILKDGQKGYHIPKNSTSGYSGLVTARTALNKSINTVALKIFNNTIGIDNAWAFAKKLGITTIQKDDYSATTGVLGGLTIGVTVEELTNAYSAIANQGTFNDSYMIEKIVDSKGNIVYQHEMKPVQAFSKQTAYLMTDMLRTVITEGTGDIVRKNYKSFSKVPIVGKTGTTQNYGDVWFEGYSPDVTLGVWVGYKLSENTLTTKVAKKRAQSIWTLVMNEATTNAPELFTTPKFDRPDGLVTKTVSAYSGKLPTALTDKFVTDLFNSKFVPRESDDGIAKAKYITYNGANYIPRDETPDDMLKEKVVIKREKPISDLIKELQAAFTKMKGGHESLASYLPRDATGDMPTEIDPRHDDGSTPSAPSNVRYSLVNGRAIITFNPSGQSDVVGYRLYRARNGNSFQNQGVVVRAGESTRFTSTGDAETMFYVTAVDVVGKESVPSASVGGQNSGSIVIPEDPGIPMTPGTDPTMPGETPVQPGTGSETETDIPEQGVVNVPTAPTQLRSSTVEHGIQFKWASASNSDMVTGYNIYYSDAQNGSFTSLGSSKDSSFLYVTSSPMKGWFEVIAINSAGESAPSAPVFFEKK
ncbi:penicillin-binding protein 1A [Paenibacillus pini]|uniref:Multimodular transpeptidase-transglycosylase n=1 Tax=Paenibacillus pini JCM 16418 TaxID=1236976 RepID=W7Y8C0_9BACL|nr:penicillin-binding protein 1A [Paenibacillus pini]GAF07160.1 multimodular transpeptidase-transglycosylase [Paenibacillus pini JCM 16418]